MTPSNPKEAIERLESSLSKEFPGLGHMRASVASADLRALIADHGRLAGEVAEWRTRAVRREEEADSYSKRAWAAEETKADLEARLSALETMLRGHIREDGSTLLTVDGVNFGTRLNQALASFAPAVPVQEGLKPSAKGEGVRGGPVLAGTQPIPSVTGPALDISSLRNDQAHPPEQGRDGWVLAPVIPAGEMLEAGEKALGEWSVARSDRDSAKAVYRAMISAAPPAQPPSQDGWVWVPQSALDWLYGSHDDGFERPDGAKGNFWWRPEFRRRIEAAAPPLVEGDE